MNLEALESRYADELVPYTTQLLRAQVARGDYFFCASERQRDYWIGMLAGLGRVTSAAYRADPDLRQLIDVVPFGIPGEPPRRTAPGVRGVVAGIGDDDPLLIWNGGLWGWFEPELFIRAIDRARARRAEHPRVFHGDARSERRRAVARVGERDRARRAARPARHARLLQRLDALRRAPERLSRRHRGRQLPSRAPRDALLVPHADPGLHLVVAADRLQHRRRPRRSRAQRAARHRGTFGRPRGRHGGHRAHRSRRRPAPVSRGTISPRSRIGTPGATRSHRSPPGSSTRRAAAPRWISTPSSATTARDPPPGSLKARVPLPLRRHVLGPAKRSLQRAATHLGDR